MTATEGGIDMTITRYERPHKRDIAPREREVLRLVAHGLRNKEIAAKLGISPRTVENYVANACLWLGARNRLDAAVRAGIVRIA